MFGIKMLLKKELAKVFFLEILGVAFLVWFYFYLPTPKQFTSKWLRDFYAGHFITLIRFHFQDFE